MILVGHGGASARRVLAATMAVANSTAMWEAGELSQGEYVKAVMVGNGIFEGRVGVNEGLRLMMALWMGGANGPGRAVQD